MASKDLASRNMLQMLTEASACLNAAAGYARLAGDTEREDDIDLLLAGTDKLVETVSAAQTDKEI